MALLKDSVLLLSASVVRIQIGFVISIVLARGLRVEDFGLYHISIAFSSTLALFFQFGWGSAAIYRVRNGLSTPARVMKTGLFAFTFFSIVLLFFCWAMQDLFQEKIFHDTSEKVFYLSVLVAPCLVFRLFFNGVARGINRFDISNWSNLILVSTILVSTLASILLGFRDIETILLCVVGSHLFTTILIGLWLVQVTGIEKGFSFQDFRESLKFGSKTHLQILAGSLHEKIDIMLLALLAVSNEQIAYYSVAIGIAGQIRLIPESIGTAVYPHIAGEEDFAAKKVTAKSSRHALFWAIILGVIFAVSGNFLITLIYGERYSESVLPFLILLVGMSALSIYMIVGRYFMSRNRHGINIGSQLISVLVNVALNLMMIPALGIVGAALASLISYILESVIIVVGFARSGQIAVSEALMMRKADFSLYVGYVKNAKSLLKGLQKK